jgi:hypothetical protein
MGSTVAGGASDATDHVFALLAVIADPAKHKAALDELVTRTDIAVAAETSAKAAHLAATTEIEKAAAATAEAKTKVEQAQSEANRRKTELDDREARLTKGEVALRENTEAVKIAQTQREQALQKAEAEFQGRAAQHDKLHAQRSEALDARETETARSLTAAQEAQGLANALAEKHAAKLKEVNTALSKLSGGA